MNKRFTSPLIVLSLLTAILFGAFFVTQPINVAQADSHQAKAISQKTKVAPLEIPDHSVLRLIPKNAESVIYCPSLQELDDRINNAAAEMVPQVGMAPELLAKILAGAFGAGFESLNELEDIGLDLREDFAVFLTSLDPPSLSAIVHLTDPEAMKEVIETEVEGSEPIQYNGETLWSTDEESGSFAILDNTLVFSQHAEVCKKVIDISKGTMQSISQNPDYTSFLANILKGTDQLAAYLDLKSIIVPFSEALTEELGSAIDSFESDPATMAAVPGMETMFGQLIEFVKELKSISATLQIEGTDVQLAPFLQFKKDGKIQETLKEMAPDELAMLNDLPNLGFLNGSFQGSPDLLLDWSIKWIKAFTTDESGLPLSTEGTDDSALGEDWAELHQQMKGFYTSLEDEWSFSANYSEGFIPDYLVIYGIKDEQKVKTYMNEQFLDQFQKTVELIKEAVGEESAQLTMYDGAYAGDPIMHNGVAIKSYIFPNFGAAFVDMPPEAANLIPQEWHWSYAFSEGQLYFGIGSAEIIKAALDSKAKSGESISDNMSYQKLIDKLGMENNLLFGFSPLTLFKGVMKMIAQTEPNAAEMQMIEGMLMDIPENYSIGFAAKVHDGGIGAKLLITLGDYKQLVQTFMMMSGMGQMQ